MPWNATATSKGEIFVIDEDASMREKLSKTMEERGYDVISFADGASLLSYVRARTPACIFVEARATARCWTCNVMLCVAAGVDERHLFEDRVSGSRGDRTGLAKALAFIKSGDCLVVWKLDRLGRSLPHLLTTVTDLKKRGIAFRSLTEQMDTTTPQGEFLFHVFGALAQFERSLIQERVQAGLAAARRRGRHGGRPTCYRCRETRGRDRGVGRRRHQGRGMSNVWHQAQHVNRLSGPGRLVCWHQGPGGMSWHDIND